MAKCEYCGKDANWYDFWTGLDIRPQRRYLCRHHQEMYREIWLRGEEWEDLVMLARVAEDELD